MSLQCKPDEKRKSIYHLDGFTKSTYIVMLLRPSRHEIGLFLGVVLKALPTKNEQYISRATFTDMDSFLTQSMD